MQETLSLSVLEYEKDDNHWESSFRSPKHKSYKIFSCTVSDHLPLKSKARQIYSQTGAKLDERIDETLVWQETKAFFQPTQTSLEYQCCYF